MDSRGTQGGKLANAEDERGAKRTFETSGVCNNLFQVGPPLSSGSARRAEMQETLKD